MKTGVLERQRINPRNKIKKLAGRDQNLYNYEESSFYQTTPTLFKTRHLQMMSKADDLQAASATLGTLGQLTTSYTSTRKSVHVPQILP